MSNAPHSPPSYIATSYDDPFPTILSSPHTSSSLKLISASNPVSPSSSISFLSNNKYSIFI